MLRSILYDVLNQNETFFFHFQSLYRQMLQHGVWSYDSLKKILLSFKEHPAKERLYLIVDAMDESDNEDRRGIISTLRQLSRNERCACVVKVFVASRPLTGLNCQVAEIEKIIRLQDENEPDILKFTESFLANLKLSPACHQKTKDYIVRNTQGVFVWVHLVEKELLKYDETGCNNNEIYNFLESLPTELDSFYERILDKLENNEQRDIKVGVKVFQLVLFAFRPLSVLEIQHALAISDDIDPEYLPSNASFEDELIKHIHKRIIHCGGNFLDIKGPHDSLKFFKIIWLTYIHAGNDIVQFMHQTVLKFFSRLFVPAAASKFRMNQDNALRSISMTCIRYLMLSVAYSTPGNEPPDLRLWKDVHFEQYVEYLNRWPFTNYALSHLQALRLQEHRDDCNQCVNIRRLVSQLSEQPANNPYSLLFGTCIDSNLGWDVAGGQWVSTDDFKRSILHTATRMQYSQVVEVVLTASINNNIKLHGTTLLLISAETGDVATARVLLLAGAWTNAKNDKGHTALQLAAKNGHDSMISLLVDSGADKNPMDEYERTALHYAAENGHDSTVRMLVETLGADQEAKEYAQQTTLRRTAVNGRTALHRAAENGHASTVQLLVETLGADKEATDIYRRTALHYAAENGHDSTVHMLVETLGANKEAKDYNGRTALHMAAGFRKNRTVRLLVSKLGANGEAEDDQKHTALHFAALFGHESTVRLLVDTLHVNKESQNKEGKTALGVAREA